jgi:hypothetical protein
MVMQYGHAHVHAIWTCTCTCNMDMHMYMQQGHATGTCRRKMQQGHAAWKRCMDMHAGLEMHIDIRHGDTDMQHGYAAWTGSNCM